MPSVSQYFLQHDRCCRAPIATTAFSSHPWLQALNISNEESGSLKAVCNATHGVCFLGTPHRGSPKADLIDTLGRLSWLWGNVPNTKITQVLIPEAEILRDVHDSFIKNPITTEIKIYTFHEGLDTKGLTVKMQLWSHGPLLIIAQIVDRFSSTVGLPDEEQSDIPADHVNMAKFDSRTDQGYIRVTGALRQLVDGIKSSLYQGTLDPASVLDTKSCLFACNTGGRQLTYYHYRGSLIGAGDYRQVTDVNITALFC